MSIPKITEAEARNIIVSQAKQFVEDTPARESSADEDHRFENLAKWLSFATGADIQEKALQELDEIITTIQELQSLDVGTHPGIELNESRTVDNRDLIRENLDSLLRDQLYNLMQSASFKAVRKVAA